MRRTLAACAVVVLSLLGLGPRTGLYRVATVLSASMGATAPPGAVAVSTPMPAGAVRAGDVITYAIPVGDHHLVTHRVVEVVEGGAAPVVRTKGDATGTVDPWLARLEPGTVWRFRFAVPGVGYVLAFLRSRQARMLLLGLVPALLATLFLRQIWSGAAPAEPPRRPRRRPRAPRLPWPRAAAGLGLALAVILAGGRALAGFADTAQAASPVGSATLSPASALNATGGCTLIIVGPKADLSWTATPSTFATGYKIERYLGATLQATNTVTPRTTTTYTATGLAANTTYVFKVYALTATWTSAAIQDDATTPLLCL